jgi:hypothetical protein
MWRLESDHRGRGHWPQMLQAQPSKERHGEAPLGYSGRTALRRMQCNVDDKALLGNDSVKQQWKDSDRCYAITQYTGVNNGVEDVFCGRCGGYITSMKPVTEQLEQTNYSFKQ